MQITYLILGAMISKAGAGPAPIPHKELTAENLTTALKFLTNPRAQSAAKRMGSQIEHEVTNLVSAPLIALIEFFAA